jgi:HK97 gp10 family phage protein
VAVTYKSYGPEFEKWVTENLALATEAVALLVWSDARQFHPWKNRTGELEKSIRIRKEKVDKTMVHYSVRAGVGKSDGIRNGSVGAGGSDKAYYAVYLELGTVKMRPYPFLRPALEKYAKKFTRVVKKIFKEGERRYKVK